MINVRPAIIFTVFAMCSICQVCLSAEEISDQSITLHDLQELKGLVFEQIYQDLSRDEQRQEQRRLSNKLNAATGKDEAVILAFIKTELMSIKTTSEDKYEKRDDLLDLLLRKFGKIGGENTVRLFIQWLSQCDWKPEDRLPIKLADTIMRISSRMSIEKELLRPLLEGKNKNLSAMATQMYQYISYEVVSSSSEKGIINCANKKEELEKLAGKIDSWKSIAQERGFIMKSNDPGGTLLRLLHDCDKRIADSQKIYYEGKLGYHDFRHLQVRETLLGLYVIEELIRTDREKAFDYLVGKMGQENNGTIEASYLYEMTGNYFPIYGHIDYGRSRTTVDQTRQAAEAWREWRKTNELRELTKPKQEEVSLEKRLADFQSKRGQIDQKESLRSVDEVISELLSTNDKRVQKMLVETVSHKTLTNEQVQKIIASAKENHSESHCIALWHVLRNSGSSSAQTYLNTVINKDTGEGTVLEFLQPISNVNMGDVTLLTSLYSEHPSALVKDHIIQIASNKIHNLENEAQMKLIESIIQVSNNDEDKLAILMSACRRSGINRRGNSIVKQTLKNEKSSVFRKTIYEKLIQYRPERWLKILLENHEPEEITLTGLLVFKEAILENRNRIKSFPRNLLSDLIRIAEHDPSGKVQLAAEEIVTEIRKKEVEKFVDNQKRRLTRIETIVKDYQEKGEVDTRIKSQLEGMNNSTFLELMINNEIEKLKDKYGTLPEEDYLKSELNRIHKAQMKLTEHILDSEN